MGATNEVLKRKLAAGQALVNPAVMSCERALHLAILKSAEKLWKLPVRTPDFSDRRLTGPELADVLPDQALICLLDGPSEGMGLAALSAGAMAAIVEVVTLGRPLDHPPPPRRPTRIDATLTAGFIDAILTEFEGLLACEEACLWSTGFRYSAHLPDRRPLGLMFEEPAYRVLRFTIAFGLPLGQDAEDRRGDLYLAFPLPGRGPKPQPRPEAAADVPSVQSAAWADDLARALSGAEAEMQAILARVSLSLGDLFRLAPGQCLTVPAHALTMVQLEGDEAQVLGRAALGADHGRRALRLADRPEGALTDALPYPGELLPAPSAPAGAHAPGGGEGGGATTGDALNEWQVDLAQEAQPVVA